MDPKTLWKLSYGMYIVCSGRADGRTNGQIANTVFQITSEPATIAVSINKNNYTHEVIAQSKVFTVSILSQTAQPNLIGAFGFRSGRDLDKFAGVKVQTGQTGAPIVLTGTLGYLEAELINSLDCGTHTIFLGRVVAAEILEDKASPMTYDYYHQIKGGKAPPNAPTYIKEPGSAQVAIKEKSVKTTEEGMKMDKYKCTICGWIYDPAQGDPDGGIAPGTPFEKIPDGWVCPVCGADKSAFEKTV